MKKILQSFVLLLGVLMVPMAATAAYVEVADGVYRDGSTLFIGSGVTSLGSLKLNPSVIYCYAQTPPACVSNTFTAYGATLHVPTTAMVNYFSAQYWYNFTNVVADAVEPESLTLSQEAIEIVVGQQFNLSAIVTPLDATPATVAWSSSDVSVATVSGGTVTTVAPGECDIFAQCIDKLALCHVTVLSDCITITLDQHEAKVLPNHMLTLTATCSPMSTDLVVSSSDNTVAMPRLVNGTIQVLGLKEGTATITVGSADGNAITDACAVTVYTELGDMNNDGFINISDVTVLINYLLNGEASAINIANADTNRDNNVNIADVTTLINYLLNGYWSWSETEVFTVNGVSFTMVIVDSGTFSMGWTAEQGDDAWDSAKPVHEVTLSSYSIGETEVTQSLWVAVMGSTPSGFNGDLYRPVDSVSWNDCKVFIAKLNEMTGKNFRLPTEAEWEYAARGGIKSKGYRFAGSNNIGDVAWYFGNAGTHSGSDFGTHTVGTKASNELGLYDMTGNVIEWCQDWMGNYNQVAQTNPTGPSTSISGGRVLRGGSWCLSASDSRISCRNYQAPYISGGDFGFRLALDIEGTNKLCLTETVVSIMIGENKSVDILNGNGNYSVEGGKDNVISSINGNCLTVKGKKAGIATVHVTSGRATTVLTVIVNAAETGL